MEHYVFVDATGQLTETCLHFADKVRRVSIVSGNEDLLHDLQVQASKKNVVISAHQANIADSHQLRHAIELLVSDNGPADVTVAALGTVGSEVAVVIAQTLRDLAVFTEFFDVSGPAEDPLHAYQREGRLRTFENVRYRKIEIGFMVDNGNSRWPSAEEVTTGIINAVEQRTSKSLIGQLEPADLRPK